MGMEKLEYHCSFRVNQYLDKKITQAVAKTGETKSEWIKNLIMKELENMGI